MASTVVVIAVVLSAAPIASAGTYVAYSCHTPTGGWASTEGWSPAGNDPSGIIRDDCQQAGANKPDGTLTAAIDPNFNREYRRHASWVFSGPAGTVILGFRAGLCAYAYGKGVVTLGPAEDPFSPGSYYHGPPPISATGVLGCHAGVPYWRTEEYAFGSNYLERTGLSSPQLWITAWCGGDPQCDAGASRATISLASVRFTLRDDHPPVVSRAAGPLASGSPATTSRLGVSFDASDVGAGLYRTIVEAKLNQSGEWKTIGLDSVDRLGGRCAPVGVSGSAYEFLYPAPCRPSVSDARTSLDSAQLPAGDHLVRVQVEDASGNRTDVVPARIVHVAIADPGRSSSGGIGGGGGGGAGGRVLPVNNGRGASDHALVRLRRSKQTVGYRAKIDVAGRVVNENDRPIVGARLQVDWRRLIPRRGVRGAAWKPLGTVTTGRGGRFVARVPSDLSRALRFSYRANVAQAGFTSAAQFALRVRARVTLLARHARVRNGRAVQFHGRVAGAVPRGGVPVTLQAWVSGRGWTPARTQQPDPRTDAKGRFKVSYRFARTYRRATYIFRIVVGEDSAFPFVRSASPRTKIVVMP